VTPLLTQIAAGLCWVLYGSFFEWFWHKHWMHTPRSPKEAFHGHTIVHHGLYKGDESYFVHEDESPEHILLKPYALPLIFLVHLPVMLAVDRFLIPHTAIGGMVACVVYFLVYEYLHWNMHVPRGHFVEKFGWFQFLRTHHKLHHRYMQKNFCVLFPLADWCLGTIITEESLARRRAEREQAIATGAALPPKKEKRKRRHRRGGEPVKWTRLTSWKLTRLTRMYGLARRLRSRRAPSRRRDRFVREIREALPPLKIRRNR